MGCARFAGNGFICGSGVFPCESCGQMSDYLCDYPMGKGKTCDLAMCDECAYPIAEDRHLCPIHRAQFEATGAKAPLKQGRLSIITGD